MDLPSRPVVKKSLKVFALFAERYIGKTKGSFRKCQKLSDLLGPRGGIELDGTEVDVPLKVIARFRS
jgi:hypothetical protein